MFDFKSPNRSPQLSSKDSTQLPPAPLKQRARWMAIMAIIILISVYYYRYTNPPTEQVTQEQSTQEQVP
jgi:capsule polysaccharide export protein KpsC/LpsZ